MELNINIVGNGNFPVEMGRFVDGISQVHVSTPKKNKS